MIPSHPLIQDIMYKRAFGVWAVLVWAFSSAGQCDVKDWVLGLEAATTNGARQTLFDGLRVCGFDSINPWRNDRVAIESKEVRESILESRVLISFATATDTLDLYLHSDGEWGLFMVSPNCSSMTDLMHMAFSRYKLIEVRQSDVQLHGMSTLVYSFKSKRARLYIYDAVDRSGHGQWLMMYQSDGRR